MTHHLRQAETIEWTTPPDLWGRLDGKWHFDLDACATDRNAVCANYFTIEDNALMQDWSKYERIYMNPPYGRACGMWVEKAWSESKKGCIVVCLLPVRTDLPWFHDYCLPHGEIEFIKGRLRFGGSTSNAPFPSMIVVFGVQERLF